MKNDLLLRVLRGEPVPRTPVWMMRQAGRYLPEYRATREAAGQFMTLCQTPELACEVTLQPLARFRLDAAILFSDILTIPDAMGLGLSFVPGEGPAFDRPVRSHADVQALPIPDMHDDLGYVMQAVRLIRRELDGSVPLIGFAGSPWTLATYMIEGQASRDFAAAKTLLYQEPRTLHLLLDKLARAVTAYLLAQIEAGAQAVMLFDSWGGSLAWQAYREYSLAYMQRIITGIGDKAPVILFTKGGGNWLDMMKDSGAAAVGLDWTTPLASARRILGENIALQGNLDPAILRASPDIIENEVRRVLADYGHGHRHIFNLGHGITPDIPPEHAAAMIEAVHKHSPQYHKEHP
ncbi:uroporphyrinogen decarboxylase [Cardiobacterium hominis]|uniref:uroporphyrinogen decarboxylase n=1 Tax=Cardiobacterium hominis TaxID=2718 RepID=UPI0028E1C208|nr:uroporphyrinogen decarboxylase [Cardiobacterium hominis]